ncbi:hypothetical protein CLF_110957, partial [Clonorchis sinensis]
MESANTWNDVVRIPDILKPNSRQQYHLDHNGGHSTGSDVEPWTVNVEPPAASEVYNCICSLKRHRSSGPDDHPPALFKHG